MTALVVFESMYGSTRAIAEAIGAGLAGSGPVRVIEVGTFAAAPGSRKLSDDITLLVVGGPTHAFGLSRPSTRADAAKEAKADFVSTGKGIREWLGDLTMPTGGLPVATFDTKVLKPNLPGSAAKGAEKALRQLGGRPVAPPRSFRVHGKSDGLVDGELEAARAWGQQLGTARIRG